MKDYFIRLFNYDHYANLTILKLIRQANDPENAVKPMAHLLAAQQIWLNRCKNDQETGIALWPGWKAGVFEPMINTNGAAWLDYLEKLDTADLEKVITYKNSAGNEYQSKLIDILGYVINHGTHHRAQIGCLLKAAGIEALPYTDYIFYLRS